MRLYGCIDAYSPLTLIHEPLCFQSEVESDETCKVLRMCPIASPTPWCTLPPPDLPVDSKEKVSSLAFRHREITLRIRIAPTQSREQRAPEADVRGLHDCSHPCWNTRLAMHLYNFTVHHPTAIPQAIVGNFSGVRQQEIIVSRGTRLELLRPDPHTGKITTVIASDVFGSIRSLAAFRLTGGTKGM